MGGLGVERVRHRRLPEPAAQRLAAEQQLIVGRAVDDGRDGLGGEAGEPGQVRLGQLAVPADQRDDQPLVVDAGLGLRGAATAAVGDLFDTVEAVAGHDFLADGGLRVKPQPSR